MTDLIAPFDAGEEQTGLVATSGVGATPDEDRPRSVRSVTSEQTGEALVAGVAAVAFVIVLRVVLDWNGVMGSALYGYGFFLTFYYLILRRSAGRILATDRLITTAIWSSGLVVAAVLVWMVAFVVVKGWPALRPGFFTQDLAKVGPRDKGGGARHAIIGTLEQVGIATIFAVPVAVLTAVYLHEISGRMTRVIRFIVDAMSGLPSIVAGLLIFSLTGLFGAGFSGIKGASALFILMLPTVTRTSEEILRTIPGSLREASMALGAPQWRVVLQVVVPTGLAGLTTAAILGIARAIGETAPMLLTALGTNATNVNPLKGAQSDLPLFVWALVRLPNKTLQERAWTGALILVLLVLVLFVLARAVGNRSARRLGRNR